MDIYVNKLHNGLYLFHILKENYKLKLYQFYAR